MADPLSHIADARDEGERADVVLARNHAALSRRVVRRLALRGQLYIDGQKSAPSTRVRAGQRIELRVPPPAEAAELAPASVLAVTDRFVYVDKPAGVATHRLGPHQPPALADAVALVHPECATSSASAREGGAVHRLDLETTGVVAFARDRSAWAAGRAAFSTPGGVDKRYVALATATDAPHEAAPWPPAHEAWWWRLAPEPVARALHPDLAIALDVRALLQRGDRRDVVTGESGQPAHTTIGALALERSGDDAWHATFLLRLHTGRRHQARVHLAALGWPILGDRRYGGAPADGLHLHAAHLDLGASVQGERPVQAPWPSAMLRAAARAHVLPSRAPGLLPPPPA